MNNDAPASAMVFVQENSFLETFAYTPKLLGFVGFYRCDKPRGEGTGLLGPATAAKEEAAKCHNQIVTRSVTSEQVSVYASLKDVNLLHYFHNFHCFGKAQNWTIAKSLGDALFKMNGLVLHSATIYLLFIFAD